MGKGGGGAFMKQNRMLLLLNYFVKNPDTTIGAASQYFKCTRRQIMYDLSKVNAYLTLIEVEQIKILSDRIYLTPRAAEKIKSVPHSSYKELIHISSEYRVGLMAIMIYCKSADAGIASFTHTLKISKGSVISDLKKLSAHAEKYDVTVAYSRQAGYCFIGEETNIRAFIFYMTAKISEHMGAELLVAKVLSHTFLDVYHDMAAKMWLFIESRKLDILPDYLALFVLFISVLHTRCKAHDLAPIDWGLQRTDDLHTVFSAFFDDKLIDDFPAWEKDYLYLLIVNASLDYKQFSRLFPDESITLREFSEDMVNRFSQISCTFIINNEKFIDNLFFHLQPAYFRLKYGMPIINPVLHKIKEDYGHFFPIVSTVLKPFADYVKRPIPEDELAYITIILLSMTEHIDEKKREPLKGAIVCQNGIASSAMLKKQLQTLFVDIEFESYFSVDDFLNSDLMPYDIVFTTVPLAETVPIPVFRASPFMSEAECMHLWKDVYSVTRSLKANLLNASSIMNVIEKYCTINDRFALETSLNKIFNPQINPIGKGKQPMLQELLTAQTIRFAKETESWETAIALCAAPLIEQGYIQADYITACTHNVHKHGPYIVIAPLVAMPHAQAPEYVNQLSMSYLNLETPVNVADQPERAAKVFIMLAAEDKTKHLNAMAALGNILSDESNLERMVYAKDVADVLQIIHDTEHKEVKK